MQSKAELRIVACPPHLFSVAWKHCGEMMLRGLAAADMDLAETMDRVVDGNCQLWLIMDGFKVCGCFLTELFEDRGVPVVGICALSGEGPSMWAAAMFRRIEQFAKAEGAKAVRFGGKAAWRRFAPEYAPIGRSGSAEVFERNVQ